ncbi:hypothetical protein [Leptospira interrogans]|uniref:hypothetical protein n=1 Tax=Leptospira interrogans TaxID=173 RepID=UPI00030BBB35|nr:hypothetical protein [Leptospira interrogans]AKP27738.1 hypothetical protein LIMLP_08305 [Leptospira interrogans serovar Manilae]AKP31511.1 hypothetical protein LIMHP_08300 [Leptospira interrogans serovar Manilae]EYU62490.1 hypothetical protein CI00_20110 [Leptospira interrogans serovar Manilae]
MIPNDLKEAIRNIPKQDQESFRQIFEQFQKDPSLGVIRPTLTPLGSYVETVSDVFRFAYQYPQDLGIYLEKNIYDLYNFVRSLPYRADPPGIETISRFKFTRLPWFPIRDCDDKTIPILSWAIFHNVPCRAVVCGQAERPHHIYPEISLNGHWHTVDATYPDRCSFGQKLYGEKFREEFYLSDFQKKFKK